MTSFLLSIMQAISIILEKTEMIQKGDLLFSVIYELQLDIKFSP